jgi:hypothetical protein
MTPAPTAPSDSERVAALLLAGGRLAIGTALWMAPRFALGALGFSKPDDQAIAVARIAGTRDLVLGAWQATVLGDRDRLGRATVAVAACDGGDALAFAALARTEEKRAAWRGIAMAVPATLIGGALAASLRRPRP